MDHFLITSMQSFFKKNNDRKHQFKTLKDPRMTSHKNLFLGTLIEYGKNKQQMQGK